MSYVKVKTKSGRPMHASVKKEIENLLDSFHVPESLDLVARSMFKRGLGVPSDKWSPLNKLIMMSRGSFDARGPKAWIAAGRRPLKGGYFFILGPRIINKKEINSNGIEESKKIVVGFNPIMVWPYEKTSGDKEIDYQIDQDLPSFFGKEVAESWGISIRQGFENPRYHSYFSQSKQEIVMATDDQQTFFSQLMKIADKKIQSKAKNVNDDFSDYEAVSQFGAAVLMRMFGLKANDKHTYDYIDRYAATSGKSVIDSVIPLINRISKSINLILDESEKVIAK